MDVCVGATGQEAEPSKYVLLRNMSMKIAGLQIPNRRKDLWVDVVLISMVLISISGLILTFIHN
jgi:hypothetical protein